MTPAAALRLAAATLLVSLVFCDRALAWYARRHFIPEARMAQAVARGPGCLVFAGDSRMVAGYDEAALTAALQAGGATDCVATIAIGALKVPGMRAAVREYLRRGGTPRTLVLGASEDTLLRSDEPPDPAQWIGNEAVLFAWSEPADVSRLYPGFPLESVRAFDQGLRFSLARSTGFGTYLSLVWQRVQGLEARATGGGEPRNVFGALADMAGAGLAMQRNAQALLGRRLAEPETTRLDPAFTDIERLVAEAHARLVVVELPMPRHYRTGVTETDVGRRYLAWLRERLAGRGERFIDFTRPAWVEREPFSDSLHLDADGATRFSTDLGRALAGLSPSEPPRAQP